MNRLVAVCHDCKKQHAYSREQLFGAGSVGMREWELKHSGHEIEFLAPDAYGLSAARNAAAGYRHNADIKIAYGPATAYTISASGLGSSSTLLIGRSSAAVDNSSGAYVDLQITGAIESGASPSANTTIQVFAVGAQDSDAPVWPDTFNGLDAAVGVTSDAIKNQICRSVANITCDGSVLTLFPFGPVSLASVLGNAHKLHQLFLTHSMGDAVGTGAPMYHQGVYYTSQ